MRRGAACALALLLIGTLPATAKDSLPWKDANPVGAPRERSKAKPPARRAEAPKAIEAAEPGATAAAAGAVADVPVPEARPPVPDETPAPPATDVAVPDARPAEALPASGPVGAPAKGVPLASDIPVPDERPAPPSEKVEAPAAGAPLPPAATVPMPNPEPSARTEAPTAPKGEPEEAPNSTDKLKSREPDVTPAATVEAAAAVEDSVACEAELKTRGAEFTVEDTISEGECGVLRPVALKRLSSGIAVSPKTRMLCRTALALDEWMADSVVPAAKADLPGETLREFRHASTYVCRPRASESGISEHARGSAIDIGSFVFASGRDIGIAAKEPNTPDAAFLDTVRRGACGPFKTVLGPGTDADHATHFHLDIAARRNGSTYCK